MSRFTPTVEVEIDFDGDKIKCTFKRMLNRHLIALGPHLVPDEQTPKAFRGNGMLRSSKLVEVARGILLECVVSFSGLKDAEGAAIKIEDAVDNAFFLPAMDELLGALIQNSTLSGVDAKKFSAQQPAAVSGEAANQTSLPESSSGIGMTLSPGA